MSTSNLSSLGSILITLGLALYAYGSAKYRLPHAPIPFNGPRGWPWQHRDWFTRRGRVYRNVGLVIEGVGGVLAILSLVSHLRN